MTQITLSLIAVVTVQISRINRDNLESAQGKPFSTILTQHNKVMTLENIKKPTMLMQKKR